MSEHVAVSVTYLGGKADSYTLNFSRPASGVYVQYYKFLRYGLFGYDRACHVMMKNAQYIRDGLRAMTKDGQPLFTMLDDGDKNCLPVVTAMLNPELNLPYDDIDLQHAIARYHWYVSGYRMNYHHPVTDERKPLFGNMSTDQSMFRVVIKNNLTRNMADHLLQAFSKALVDLDENRHLNPISQTLQVRPSH